MRKTNQLPAKINNAFAEIQEAIQVAARAACASESLYEVWSLINQSHALRRQEERFARSLENVYPRA